MSKMGYIKPSTEQNKSIKYYREINLIASYNQARRIRTWHAILGKGFFLFNFFFFKGISPNIYKEARKTTVPYCNTADSAFGNRTMGESNAGASVGFSPWSAILFPVTFTLLRYLDLNVFFKCFFFFLETSSLGFSRGKDY